jgi:hypothetical protein
MREGAPVLGFGGRLWRRVEVEVRPVAGVFGEFFPVLRRVLGGTQASLWRWGRRKNKKRAAK